MPFLRKLQRPWYAFLQFISRLLATVFFGYRCHGQRHLPTTGGALLLSSHQCFLDPVFIGVPAFRPQNYVVRESLFRLLPLRWLSQSLYAFPIDRDGLGLSGLKETLRRLKRGEIVVIFPEGTRTPNGRIQPLKPGFAALARRANVPLLTAAIVGAYESWPRTRPWPSRGQVRVHIGPPMWPAEVAQFDDRQLVAEIERRMTECHVAAHAPRSRCLASWGPAKSDSSFAP